jgi:glyoxylase-like metal-dependent hydrolase (beta-lactamase superfamily II)/8-oxo-dGTP pyrophosphatase MutT (NUDIX family)
MEPRPASTVVLVRPRPDGLEVLLTQRPATMAFAGDMHVFPGGAVDPADGEMGTELAFEVAAIRELFEEAGVLLAEPATEGVALGEARASLLSGGATLAQVARALRVRLRFDLLAPLSQWVTPPFVERRFDVRFFAAQLPADAEPSFVGDEVADHVWMTPRAALEARARGAIGLWVPTAATLQQLEHVAGFDEIRTRLAPSEVTPIGLNEDTPDVVRVTLPGAGAVPGQQVNAYVIGRRELVVIDPGDPSDAAADAILALATGRDARILAIVLTSPEPDHAAGAEALAGRIHVPVFAGRGAARWLPYDVAELSDGDAIPVGDTRITAVGTAGPRAEHLAFDAAENGSIFVGDLVGSGPSRAILAPPDERAWVASLDRVAALAPRSLFPAHGDPPPDPLAAIDARRSSSRAATRPGSG